MIVAGKLRVIIFSIFQIFFSFLFFGHAAQHGGGGGGGDNGGTAENGRHSDLAALYTIVAVFPRPLAAQNASLHFNKLRVAKKNYGLRLLEQARSQ